MLQISPETRSFLSEHKADDPVRLLLSASRYAGVDVRWVAGQLEVQRQIRTKLPEWYAVADRLTLPGKLPAEQCSSEQTAKYKRRLVVGSSLCDLTGGMGVDIYYMSRGLGQSTPQTEENYGQGETLRPEHLDRTLYIERQAQLCEAARQNFAALGATDIVVLEDDVLTGNGERIPDADTLYLDPARRAHDGSRVYDVADCEPDIVAWRDALLRHCRRLVVKVSPMADISNICHRLAGISEVHVVAVKNECKELLLVLDGDRAEQKQAPSAGEIRICCVDFKTEGEMRFDFTQAEESEAEAPCAGCMSACYLYEPDVTLLKAGAFKLPATRYKLNKMDTHTHLYTSEERIPGFPGKTFVIDGIQGFTGRQLRELKGRTPQANIATRNFPLSADELRRRSGLKDGGETTLFGATTRQDGPLLFWCRRCLVLFLALCLLVPADLGARSKKRDKTPAGDIGQMLSCISLPAPGLWNRGMEFVYLNAEINATLLPETLSADKDSTDYRNTVWTFEGIVSEEDWMGQQTMSLRFRSPSGPVYRYATGRLMSQVADTTYHPAIPGFCALDPIRQCHERLKGKSFYLLLNDERVLTADSVRLEKYVVVRVDSVTVGSELAPLRVWFTHPAGASSVLTSLPGSRENATSTPIQKFFSVTDPYLRHPDIEPEVWTLIRHNQVRQGMTIEEVRLSLGRPQRYERYATKVGIVERWHYSDRMVVEFVDNRLYTVALER